MSTLAIERRDGAAVTLGVSEQVRASVTRAVSVGRSASPEEAARGVHCASCSASDCVHGQALNISRCLAVGMAG